MKFKLTALEKQWILYDVGNSAFVLLVSTILPIYFNYLGDKAGLSSVDYLAYWGYAVSVSTLIVAFLGPVLGSIADVQNYKKRLFAGSMILGVISCVLLGIAPSWLWFLCIFVVAKTAYSVSLIFYDAMLTDVTTDERMDTVSSNGYAWGYIGSCIPFILSLLVVLNYDKLNLAMSHAMFIAFLITGAWWLISSLPLLQNYKQTYYISMQEHIVHNSFSRLGRTFSEITRDKKILFFSWHSSFTLMEFIPLLIWQPLTASHLDWTVLDYYWRFC